MIKDKTSKGLKIGDKVESSCGTIFIIEDICGNQLVGEITESKYTNGGFILCQSREVKKITSSLVK